MKLIKKYFILSLSIATLSSPSTAAEKRPSKDIDTDEMTSECQISPVTQSDHLALAWWIPNEFWEANLDQDPTTAPEDKKEMLDAMRGTSILAIVQADITNLGVFKFYDEETVSETQKLSYIDADGKAHKLVILEQVKPELQMVMGIMKPMLSNAMGEMGKNFHFYILDDVGENKQRVLDPYKKGSLKIGLETKALEKLNAEIKFPLNSLFVPRLCPNGQKAHVSWEFCPWTGKKLEQ